jgi:hypothetical protein
MAMEFINKMTKLKYLEDDGKATDLFLIHLDYNEDNLADQLENDATTFFLLKKDDYAYAEKLKTSTEYIEVDPAKELKKHQNLLWIKNEFKEKGREYKLTSSVLAAGTSSTEEDAKAVMADLVKLGYLSEDGSSTDLMWRRVRPTKDSESKAYMLKPFTGDFGKITIEDRSKGDYKLTPEEEKFGPGMGAPWVTEPLIESKLTALEYFTQLKEAELAKNAVKSAAIPSGDAGALSAQDTCSGCES